MNQEDGKATLPAAVAEPETAHGASATGADEGESPEAAVERLRARVAELEEEIAKAQDRFLRERAEVENFKRRTQRDQLEALRFASEPLVRDLLPVLDNLERALQHGKGKGQSILDGIKLILKSLADLLEGHGLKSIDATGQTFDPAKHQALAQVQSAEHEPNQVVEQLQKGYMLHDRLLRPALVTVGAPKANRSVETPQNSD